MKKIISLAAAAALTLSTLNSFAAYADSYSDVDSTAFPPEDPYVYETEQGSETEQDSNILNPEDDVQEPGSDVQDPGSNIQDPGSDIQDPGSDVQETYEPDDTPETWEMTPVYANEGDYGITYDEATQTLTITGSGPLPDYTDQNGHWYEDYGQIKSVKINPGITLIGSYSFSRCTSLEYVSIPNTVTMIGEYAFLKCENLKEVIIPDSVTTLGKSAFSQCGKLERLTLSNNLTNIPDHAFFGCKSLTEVKLPDNLTKISQYAFGYCESLKGIRIPDSVTNIEGNAFNLCIAMTEITTGTNLLRIGGQAFYQTSTKIGVYGDKMANKITLDLSRSQKLEFIGEKAFSYSAITSADIPDSVTTIERYAFNCCWNLTKVKLPKNLKEITQYAFANTDMESIEIPESVTVIGDHAFYKCSLKKIVIPHSVGTVGESAFSGTKSLTAVDISGDPALIGKPFASGCTHVHISAGTSPSYYAGNYGLPEDESCYFQVGADGKCSALNCPFRDGTVVKGDVSGDGKFTLGDIIKLAFEYRRKNADKYVPSADMNGDGKITLFDIIKLCSILRGK